NAPAGLPLAPRQAARLASKHGMNLLPHPGAPPRPPIPIHRLPRRELVRQQAPGTAPAQEVKERVEHLAHVGRARPSPRLGARNQMLEYGPFLIAQITRIGFAVHPPKLSHPTSQTSSRKDQIYTLPGYKLRFSCHSERGEESLLTAFPAERFFASAPLRLRMTGPTASLCLYLRGSFRPVHELARFHQPFRAGLFVLYQRAEQLFGLLIFLDLINHVGDKAQSFGQVRDLIGNVLEFLAVSLLLGSVDAH